MSLDYINDVLVIYQTYLIPNYINVLGFDNDVIGELFLVSGIHMIFLQTLWREKLARKRNTLKQKIHA